MGHDIHIEGDFIVNVLESQCRNFGITFLKPTFFLDNVSSKLDVDNWKRGFSFNIPAIMDDLDFKRQTLIDEIKKQLENSNNQNTLLLLGKSGSSKSNLIKNIICHYFKNNYMIFYNEGQDEIKNLDELINFLIEKVKDNNKILVAIDNVHNVRTAGIFYVIDKLQNFIMKDHIKFILTGTQPEFDRFLKDRLHQINSESIRESILKVDQKKIEFCIKNFDYNETK